MNSKDLLFKTIFACMACDGDIAPEEVQLLRDIIANTELFSDLDVNATLKNYVDSINENGVAFLNHYLTRLQKLNCLRKSKCA